MNRTRLKRTRLASLSGAVLALMIVAPTVLAATTTVVVTPSDLGTSWFTADTRPNGTGTFENGPATPPLGTGSFELSTMSGTSDKVQLFTNQFDGTALSAIDGLGYSTYRDPASTGFIAGAAAINIRVDTTGDGSPDFYLVYEPYQDMGNAAVLTGVWQDWDAYRGGAAKWWTSNNAGGCGQNTPCTWTTIVGLFPGATIEESSAVCGNLAFPIATCPGSFGVNQGSFNPGIRSNADALHISVSGNMTTFDFELTPPPPPQPVTKDDCKKGGWASLARADASPFKNQGDCIQYVNTGK